MKHPILILAERYPQLKMPIAPGTRETEEYKNAVLRGLPCTAEPCFTFSERDSLTTAVTPAGPVDVLFLQEREDFEHAYRALAYKCEPRDIPASMGAGFISGLANWEKIQKHKTDYLLSGGQDWNNEFRAFTADKSNYTDAIVVLSSGLYSNVPAAEAGVESTLWAEKSVTIRKFHELAHFVCRRLYPGNVDAVRDEVMADAVGLLAAFGRYDRTLALRLLGISGDAFIPGGRLANYVEPDALDGAVAQAKDTVARCAAAAVRCDPEDPFSLLTNGVLL